MGSSPSIIDGAARWLGARFSRDLSRDLPPLSRRFRADEEVVLGATGIKTSLLAMGTGTRGGDQRSNQTALGTQGLRDLLLHGYERGLRFFDAADSYGSHAHTAAALKHVDREIVTVMTKSYARDAAGMRADIDRFRRELGTEYIDILLMHCVREADWTERHRGAMDALSEAKRRGVIRAHGCSCHGFKALEAAARSPWVEIDLVRLNPIGAHMDARPEKVLRVVRAMRAAGKGIVGMKILGQGEMRGRESQALHYALFTGALDAFTIGAESIAEQEDLMRRIDAIGAQT